MILKSDPKAFTSSSLLPLAAFTLALAIFAADTFTKLEIAVPVFYTAVILISVRFCSRRGVILICLGCIALTIVSDLLTPASNMSPAGLVNTVISILAMATTTYLALKIEFVERAIYDARAQLAHAARVTALGELTASIAHEVNQPIAATIINGNASLHWLAAEPPNLDEARTAIECIVKDANRAAEVVGRVRELAKRAPAQKVPCDINAVVLDIIKLTASEIQKHRVTLQTDLRNDLDPVEADPVQLQQVILNLVLNAIEAMEDRPGVNRLLFIGSAKDGSGVTVTVRDSGKGLGDTTPEQIFDAFFTTNPSGMGLGLTITRSIVEAHGGRIWAEPDKSGGATFRFTLPVVPGRL